MARTTQIWDMLSMGWHVYDGGWVTTNYQREELAPGDELLSLRRNYNHNNFWPQVVILAAEETWVRVNVTYDPNGDEMNIFTIDINDPDGVDIAIGDPEKPSVLSLKLISFTLKVEEYDEFEETTKYFYIDDQDWEKAMNGDPVAAQAVADEVAEQLPESLEIICRYMTLAAELGSKDAQDWLAEYYHGDDGRYDAYV